MLAATDGGFAGMVGVADLIKASAPEVVKALRANGVHVVILTGDNAATAKAAAQQL